MNIKNVLTAVLFSTVATSAMAAPQICPFTDTFDISGPGNIQIQGTPITQGNLKYTKTNNNEFTLSCAHNNKVTNGYLFINIGTDATAHLCQLTIYDGPYVMDPEVQNVNCSGGLQYNGYAHRTGTYQYTLKFSQNSK